MRGGKEWTTVNSKEQFEARVDKAINGCWLWIRSLNGWGYGQITVKRSHKSAHRYAWELYVGPIPEGLLVLHRCDVRRCVNPEHLYLGTDLDNARNASVRKTTFNGSRTHCKYGHEFSTENTVTYHGRRVCLACRKRWNDLYNSERSASRLVRRKLWK